MFIAISRREFFFIGGDELEALDAKLGNTHPSLNFEESKMIYNMYKGSSKQ